MSRFINCLVAVLSSMTFAAAAANMPSQLEGVAGKPIKLTLDASPATGYQWMVSQLPAGLLLIPGSYHQLPDCKPGMVGCSGQQTFYLIGRKAGTSTLKMIYGRTFDSADWHENSIRVVISAAP